MTRDELIETLAERQYTSRQQARSQAFTPWRQLADSQKRRECDVVLRNDWPALVQFVAEWLEANDAGLPVLATAWREDVA